MKPNTLIILASKDVPAVLLKRLKSRNAALPLHAREDVVALHCKLVSSDGFFVWVKFQYPVKGKKECVATVAIPYGAVLLMVQSDQSEMVGFAVKH